MLYFWGSVAMLALLLYFPVTRLIWALSVHRLERKRHETLARSEIDAQFNRARFIAILVCTVTAILFNLQLLGWPLRG